MRERVFEVLFRHKLLIILPVFVILPITIMLAARPRPQSWQAFATIWVDQYTPLYEDWRLGDSPAFSTSRLLNNFIGTYSFASKVIGDTSLAPLLDDPASEEYAMDLFHASLNVWTTSNDFVVIATTTPNPELAVELIEALLVHYQAELDARNQTQIDVATAYYAEEMRKAEEAMEKSRGELAAYLQSFPSLARGAADAGDLMTARDATLGRLESKLRIDEETYGRMRAKYDEIQADAKTSAQGRPLAFTIVDEPRLPIDPLSQGRMGLLKLPFIGLVMSLILSSVIAVVLVVTSHAVMGKNDLEGALGVPVLGEIPPLRRRRWLWQRRPRHAVRLHLSSPARALSS
jgi:uncharacterized protein involved in exopolysaccharide biosynthesis